MSGTFKHATVWTLKKNKLATRLISVHLATRGHFRSLDKDDGHTIRSAKILCYTRKLQGLGSIFYRTGVIADQSFTLWKYEFSTFLAPVTLNLTR